jgi:D-3-phosphoglycerate dehydrogenase
MRKVLVTDPIAEEGIRMMKEAGLGVDVKIGMTQEELKSCIGEYDAIIVRSATKVTADVIKAGKNLKIIARGGVGLDNIDTDAANRAGIKVVNTPAATSISVAELAMAHLLGLCRFLPQANITMRQGKWRKKEYTGIEVRGKTLGIVGLGRIGHEMAKIAIGLGMKVIATDPLVKETELDLRLVSMDELLRDSDFISLHVPKQDTGPLIGEAEFKRMKDGVILINCARGGVIDESALLDALNSGKVAGAGLDVFEDEPNINMELVKHPNVSVSPHIGASTVEGQYRVGLEVAKLVIDILT